ncbi:protein MTSS 1 isoform X3 [Girardinichthys multiradiatus]|uniref:protein MTSS 1 isoform X3 n=1 Tax=Girardinichthys multiradiatus TaxID=208333 RepID=UPI001FABF301|nr:protein MTSS 1 isoform X3 [Girardinichthys multiradiatus]
MDAGIEKECSALGGLFQLIMNDMKASYPTWEDFVSKGTKLQSHLRTTIVLTGAFLDAFQKVADMATGTRGATKEIGSALTRMCMRHRSIESKLKLFTTALSESLITPLELKMEEWKKVASQLDKDHAKEYKKARADIKKKSSDTIKLQKKVKKGKDEARGQLDSALQDVNVRYAFLEETEKRAVCRALIEERSRYCSFVSMLKPVLDHEINMLGEVTHLQTILEDLTVLTAEPSKLPPTSEQVILDLKGSDFNYTYQTPPASPSNMSRRSSISSYQCGSVRHVPSLDSISCAVDGVHLQPSSPYLLYGCDESGRSLSEGNSPSRLSRRSSRGCYGSTADYGRHAAQSRRVSRRDMTTDAVGSTNQLASAGTGGPENGLLPPPHNTYVHQGERARAMSASGKSSSARDQLMLGGLNSDAPTSSRESLHCSSGYSTQTTTPSCSEDTIHTHTVRRDPPPYADYESISLHGDTISFHQLSHGNSQSDFDKSSTIPRNSDLRFQYKEFAQSKRPMSTISLLAEGELSSSSGWQLSSHTATIRRKPSSKSTYRRGTISGGIPIPISTPQVPLKAVGGNGNSDENVFKVPPPGGVGGLGHNRLCTSTQSLSSLPSSSSPYYQFIPGQMPIPVPVPTVPPVPPEGGNIKQQQQRQHLQQLQQQQQISQQLNHQQQRGQLQQHQQQFQQPQQHQLQQLFQQPQQDAQQHQLQQLFQQPQQDAQQHQLQQQVQQPQQHAQQHQLQQQVQQPQQHAQQHQPQQQVQQPQQHAQQHQLQQQVQQPQQHAQQHQLQQQVQQPQRQLEQQNLHVHFQQQQLMQQQLQQQLHMQQQQRQHQQHFQPPQQLQEHLHLQAQWNQFGPPAAGQKQMMLQQQHQAQLQATAAAQVQPNNLEPRLNHQSLNDSSSQDQNPEQPGQEGGGVDMLTLIRKVKLKQSVTNDRSAPLLPPPVNHN